MFPQHRSWDFEHHLSICSINAVIYFPDGRLRLRPGAGDLGCNLKQPGEVDLFLRELRDLILIYLWSYCVMLLESTTRPADLCFVNMAAFNPGLRRFTILQTKNIKHDLIWN